MNWNEKADQVKEQKELIELALSLYEKHNSVLNSINELEDHFENWDRSDCEIEADQNLNRLLDTVFSAESMKVLFSKGMTKEERTSYFYISVELLKVIYDDLNDEAIVEKLCDAKLLKRLFQFSKKAQLAKNMILDDHSPFSTNNYL